MNRRNFLTTVGAALSSSIWSRFSPKIIEYYDPDGWPLKYICYDRDITQNHIERFQRRGFDIAYAKDVREIRDDDAKILLAVVEKESNAKRHRGEWGHSKDEILLSASGKSVSAEAPVQEIGLIEIGLKMIYK